MFLFIRKLLFIRSSYTVFTIKERNTIRRDEHELDKYLQGVERLQRPTATIKRKAAAEGI